MNIHHTAFAFIRYMPLIFCLFILPANSISAASHSNDTGADSAETDTAKEESNSEAEGEQASSEDGKIQGSMQDIQVIQQLMGSLRQDFESNKENSSVNSERMQKLNDSLSLIDEKLKEAYTGLDDSRGIIKSNVEEIQNLQKELALIATDIRASSTDVGEQKSLIEDNSIRLYELLIEMNEQAQTLNDINASVSGSQDLGAKPLNDLRDTMNATISHLWLILATVLVLFAPVAFVLSGISYTVLQADGTPPNHGMLFACLGAFLGYFILGFGLMYGISSSGWIGIPTHLLEDLPSDIITAFSFSEFILYKTGFAMLAALIVYASVVSQLNSGKHILLAIFVGAILIPIFGHWVNASFYIPNNRGWLEDIGFIDQAGAITIHTVAGWFAFIVCWRMGNPKSVVPADNTSDAPVYSATAALLLGLSWFGFTTGTLPISDEQIPDVIVNVCLASSAGGLTAFIHYLFFHTNKEISIARGLGGYVSGLVAIAACSQSVTFFEAMVIGAGAGLLQNIAYGILRKYFLTQAWQTQAAYLVAIHGVAGAWGALCFGLLGTEGNFERPDLLQVGIQAQGIAVAILYSIVMARIALLFLLHQGKKKATKNPVPAV